MIEQKIPQRLLAVSEVAELCHVSEMTARRWTSTGMLPAVTWGQLVVRVRPKDLEEFIEEWLIPMEAQLTPLWQEAKQCLFLLATAMHEE